MLAPSEGWAAVVGCAGVHPPEVAYGFPGATGLVSALSARCAELESSAARVAELEEAGNTFEVVARALAGLRRMESLVERDGTPVDLRRLPQA